MRDRPKEFSERGLIPKAELLKRFDQIVDRASKVLGSLDGSALVEPKSYSGLNQQYHMTSLGLVFRTLTHLSGHTQEIVYITRLQLGDGYVFQES